MKRGSVDIITLGCSKNLVDSEKLMAQFRANGLKVRHDPEVPDAFLAEKALHECIVGHLL